MGLKRKVVPTGPPAEAGSLAEALVPLGLPDGRSPSVATLHRVVTRLDVAAFEQAVGGWLERTGVERVSAPQLMAAGRHLVLALLRRQRRTNIAAALRTYASRPRSAIHFVARAHHRVVK